MVQIIEQYLNNNTPSVLPTCFCYKMSKINLDKDIERLKKENSDRERKIHCKRKNALLW